MPAAEADSANRTKLFHSTKHPARPNCRLRLPISPEDFHNRMSTSPAFQRHGVVHDTRFRTPIWQSAPHELAPHVEILRQFRLVVDDRTRRQPRRVMLEDDQRCPAGTLVEQHGRQRCLCNNLLYAIIHHNLRHICNFRDFDIFSRGQSMSRLYLSHISDVLFHVFA